VAFLLLESSFRPRFSKYPKPKRGIGPGSLKTGAKEGYRPRSNRTRSQKVAGSQGYRPQSKETRCQKRVNGFGSSNNRSHTLYLGFKIDKPFFRPAPPAPLFDPFFFLMNPSPLYTVQLLQHVFPTTTHVDQDGSKFQVANQVQSQIGTALGFHCTEPPPQSSTRCHRRPSPAAANPPSSTPPMAPTMAPHHQRLSLSLSASTSLPHNLPHEASLVDASVVLRLVVETSASATSNAMAHTPRPCLAAKERQAAASQVGMARGVWMQFVFWFECSLQQPWASKGWIKKKNLLPMASVLTDPRHKTGSMASGDNRGQKVNFLASPQYASVPDPRQNAEINRGRKPLLHWWWKQNLVTQVFVPFS